MAIAGQHLQREGVQLRTRARSCRKGAELALSKITEQRLGKDRARGVAGTDEENVERFLIHVDRVPKVGLAKGGAATAAIHDQIVN